MYKSKRSIKSQSISSNDGAVKVWEYGGIDEGLDIAVAEIEGNYPGEGKWSKNTKTKTMTYYVLEGEATFRFKGGGEFFIKKGDCVFISRDRFYQVEVVQGEKVKVLMASNPAWSPEQYVVSD